MSRLLFFTLGCILLLRLPQCDRQANTPEQGKAPDVSYTDTTAVDSAQVWGRGMGIIIDKPQ